MSNEEKLTTGETIIKHFATIKELSDSASALFAKTDTATSKTDIGTAAFEITEKIQEEIEEIRDLLFEGE